MRVGRSIPRLQRNGFTPKKCKGRGIHNRGGGTTLPPWYLRLYPPTLVKGLRGSETKIYARYNGEVGRKRMPCKRVSFRFESRLKRYAASGNLTSHRTAEPTEFARFQELLRDFGRLIFLHAGIPQIPKVFRFLRFWTPFLRFEAVLHGFWYSVRVFHLNGQCKLHGSADKNLCV